MESTNLTEYVGLTILLLMLGSGTVLAIDSLAGGRLATVLVELLIG